MTDYFSEKTRQVSPESLTAFGIEISSRYGNAREIIEMINFAERAARSGVAHFVKEVFYDSKADMCSFAISPSVEPHSGEAGKLKEAALSSICQFNWFGYICHGAQLAANDE